VRFLGVIVSIRRGRGNAARAVRFGAAIFGFVPTLASTTARAAEVTAAGFFDRHWPGMVLLALTAAAAGLLLVRLTRLRQARDRLTETVNARTRGLIASNEQLKAEIAERRRAAGELHTSEQRYRALVEDQAQLICQSGPDGTLRFVNTAYAAFHGSTPERLIGRNYLDLLDGEDRAATVEFLSALSAAQPVRTFERQTRRADGERRWHLWNVRAFVDGAGAVESLQAVGTDITERRRTERRLRQLSQAVEQSPVSVVITDTRGDIAYVNPQFERVSGYAADEVMGRNPRILKSGHSPDWVYREMWRTIADGGTWQGEFHNKCKDGSMIWERASISPILDGAGEISNYLCLKEDITLHKEYEAKLVRQATFDEATNLPNRFLAIDRLGQAINNARRHNRKVAVLFVDLDNFKTVNDTLGHAAGDNVLRLAGERFLGNVRGGDTVARLGGDEFMIVLGELTESGDAEVVAEKLVAQFNDPLQLEGGDQFVTTSIGIAVFPEDGTEPQALMRNADAAMYRVKQSGRNGYQFFTREIGRQTRTRVEIEKQLRHAMERGEFQLHYQSIADIDSRGIHHAEALLRWHNVELGDVPPDRFIRIAEETGLITTIGEWVLRTACRQARDWGRAGLPLAWVSVNVSSRQFRNKDFVERITAILQETGMPPDSLNLEITESVLMDEFREIEEKLFRLSDMGIRMTIDDFGTGYSSLSYLRRFPVRTLKIDKSFIFDLMTDPNEAKLVEAIVAMGRSLGLEVIAEGVEETEQMDFLRRLGCDMGQGFLISEPVPADQFAGLLARPREGWPAPAG